MTIFTGLGSPQSVAGANGGRCYAFNNVSNAANVVIAPLRPERRKITFVNPGNSVILYVSMTVQIDPIFGSQTPLTPTLSALGGTLPVYPGSFVTIEGDCQAQWQALAASGTTNPITVLDSFA